jgi:hypothetical protein
MKRKIRDGWASRLESGRYMQAREVLREPDVTTDQCVEEGGRCCLGVLCDYAIEEGVEGIRWDGEHYRELCPDCQGGNYYCGCGSVADEHGNYWRMHDGGDLPHAVRTWAGVGSNPTLDTNMDDGSAIELNDSAGYNFKQIASLVRELPVEDPS